MEVLTEPAPNTPPALAGGSAVTIGAFDGVHRGHLALLGELRRRADQQGYPTVVVTFDRHPATVVRPESAPELLTDLEQKLELLDRSGLVDHCVVVPFDAHRAGQEADDFVEEAFVGWLHARLVVVGEDFHFGRGRRGNVGLLRALGQSFGFEVVGLGLVPAGPERPNRARNTGREGKPVSSTAIRRLLTSGDVETAAELLGRPHEVRGAVITGERRGLELGFPTANVEVPAGILVPAEGIYAGWYERADGTVHRAAMSWGRRPTFESGGRAVLEAYLLDFEGDLYGEAAKVRFVSRLRDDQRFDSAEELVVQMQRDIEATRAALAG